MMGTLGWHWDIVKTMTLRELIQCYDAKVVDAWDQTTTIATAVQNLIVVTNNINSKRKMKPKTFLDLHPYRKRKPHGMKLTKENFHVLRDIGNMMVANK